MIEQDWEEIVDDLLNKESGLTSWEIDFIDSLDKQRGRKLSEKQIQCLERIVDKVL